MSGDEKEDLPTTETEPAKEAEAPPTAPPVEEPPKGETVTKEDDAS